jgi:hypothetical protein
MGCMERAGVPADPDVAAWLASRTGASLDEVKRELDDGVKRRAFVVDELLEAGLEGPELLELVVRLTGLDAASARQLIAEERKDLA